jgi:electron transport complex protein RnfE
MAENTATKTKSEASLRHKASFVNGIIKENPLFVAILGTCPALAVTTYFENALGMGLLFMFVLVCSNVIISLLKKLIPEVASTPCYIVIIAAFVTIVKMFTNAFIPVLYSSLGVFLSLLVVNCIVLGRAEAFANKNTVFDSFLDGIGNGIGYTLAICLIALIREILGTGMITIGRVFTFIPQIQIPILKATEDTLIKGNYDFSMSLFSNSAGGFIVFGLCLAVINFVHLRKADKEKAAKVAAMKKAAAAKTTPVSATPVFKAEEKKVTKPVVAKPGVPTPHPVEVKREDKPAASAAEVKKGEN